MTRDVTVAIDCTSLDQTLALAERLGARLRGQEVVELVSDLGGGKTTFVRGLAEGMGSSDLVSSPTFTLTNIYTSPKLTMHHFDFYRLAAAGIMRDELQEVLADPAAVAVIEWADIVADVLPPKHLRLQLSATGESSRQIVITAPSELTYMVEGIS